MNKYLLFVKISLLAFSIYLAGCKHDIQQPQPNQPKPDPANPVTRTCSPDTVYFERDVLPILISNCAMSGCHDAASHQDGVILTDYNNIRNTADVRPGNANGSDLFEVLIETDSRKRMPQGGQLSSDKIMLIEKWINQGALNNNCVETNCDTAQVRYSGHIKTIIQNNCNGCHSTAVASGGIVLDTYAGISSVASNGKLLGSVRHDSGFKAMPQGGAKLPDCSLAQIRIWVNNGFPNN